MKNDYPKTVTVFSIGFFTGALGAFAYLAFEGFQIVLTIGIYLVSCEGIVPREPVQFNAVHIVALTDVL